jgi:hypothetical protein
MRPRTPVATASNAVASSSRSESPSPTVATAARVLPGPQQARFPDCRLPYVELVNGGPAFLGGWISGPDGHFTADPAGVYKLSSEDTPSTAAAPVLPGSFSTPTGSYDRAVRRWLPVSRDVVRSDGLAYAYAEAYRVKPSDQFESQTHLHVVSLATGVDRIIYSGGPYDVVAYEPEGIYLVGVHYYAGETTSGLWRVDPTSGVVVQVEAAGYFVHVGNGFGWTLDRGIQPSILNRVDLRTRSTQTWADVTNAAWLYFVGQDSSGLPFVEVEKFDGAGALVHYGAPKSSTTIGTGDFWPGTVTDGHGTWFSGPDGVYLYAAGRLERVSSGVSGYGYPAGACV